MLEHGFSRLVGLALVGFALLNARRQLARGWVKQLGASLFGNSGVRHFVDDFADGSFARTFYGPIITIFAGFVGFMWVYISILLLVGDLKRLG
ncbi:MAG: hypothetical protein E6I43_09780 [Chloroflexi bacterium]|nr:MAG: hypothetical protein E6I43_09780 [Chloroflexota bacterium]